MLDNRRNELMLVGLLVWFILSIGVFIILFLPFVMPQHQLAQFIPECDWQTQFHKPCAFCGMTTAFYAISRGDFVQAHHLNALSLYIYLIFLLNTILAVIALKPSVHFIKDIGTTLHNSSALS